MSSGAQRTRSLALQEKAQKLIPGVAQLLSKRPQMFAPGQWPGYFSRAKGVETWDLDGNKYIDMSISGIGANVLGFADTDVDAAVLQAIKDGTSSSLNCPEEVELAEVLCALHPWAAMVRYARTGGEAMAVAVRIARAHTKRDKIAFCGYHGWHDWYLAANLANDSSLDGHLLPGLAPNGVPRSLIGTAIPFRYNHLEELQEIVSRERGSLAAIVMEPLRDQAPQPGFLEGVRALAAECGAVLVFDEITAGMRLCTGGAHLLYHVNPDIAVFAKAISNGYPMAAIIGLEDVMQAAQISFISSTYWTERIGPVAALATIKKHRQNNVAAHLVAIGGRIQQGWRDAAAEAGLAVHVSGIPPLSHFHFEHDDGRVKATLFTQMMLERGYLASGRFYASYAHQDAHVSSYLVETRKIFGAIAEAARTGNLEKLMKGPAAHSGFQRLT
jgi:glutamate-1-semialdehyde 2,1-aminomutase